MLSIYRHMFVIPDLRKKILFTLAMFGVYRLGASLPVPGVNLERLRTFQEQQASGGIYGLLNVFSGGALENLSVFSLGILPYITSSIIMQLLTVVIPRLQSLQEEGEGGRKVITQWTRYLTVMLSLIQSSGITYLFHIGRFTGGIDLIPNYTPGRVALIVLTMTAGTAFIMWLGELITQRGVGNGISLLMFASILSQFPFIIGQVWAQTVDAGRPTRFFIVLAPVIFASSVLAIPALIVTAIPSDNVVIQTVRNWVDRNLGAGGSPTWWYILVLFGLIIFFTYFYTAIQFDPARQSELIQRQGGFIPGVRPGTATARHLGNILNRITLPGSVFLAIIAVLPAVAGAISGIAISFSGGAI